MSRHEPSVDLGYPTKAHGRIPAFRSVEEEAAFWDTHSVTDFPAELVPVQARIAENLSAPLTVRLDPRDRAELTRRARAWGIGPSTLVRMWVRERLQREVDADAASGRT